MCDAFRSIATSTYSNATNTFDGSIVAPRSGNDFRFFGLIAGPGIELIQTPTQVLIRQASIFTRSGMYMNLGQNITHTSPVDFYPDLFANLPGQFNDGYYSDGVITFPSTNSYTISVSITHASDDITATLEDLQGIQYATGVKTYNSPNPSTFRNSLSFSRTLDIPGGTQLRLRLTSQSSGTILLSKSFITVYLI
jgi:hypothetical protein